MSIVIIWFPVYYLINLVVFLIDYKAKFLKGFHLAKVMADLRVGLYVISDVLISI